MTGCRQEAVRGGCGERDNVVFPVAIVGGGRRSSREGGEAYESVRRHLPLWPCQSVAVPERVLGDQKRI